MMVYPSFVYLQNHKTGCSFVEEYLKRFCAEPLIKYAKHAALDAAPGKFCFSNVREPVSLYRSLFTYGLDGKGTIYHRLCRLGRGSFYERGPEGFRDWLAFVLKPNHAPLLADRFRPHTACHMGLMTWRLLRLACPGFELKAQKLSDSAVLLHWIEQHWILDAVLKQERLRDDLVVLTRNVLAPAIPDQPGALTWLAQAQSINTSEANISDIKLPVTLLKEVHARESFIYRHFYSECQIGTAIGLCNDVRVVS